MTTATEMARIEGTTKYRKSVVQTASKTKTGLEVLKPGNNNKKLGYKITKGRWKGKYLYSITLEERATCPRSCHHWDDCYGNNMPFAKRYSANSSLCASIHSDIMRLRTKHPQGIVIRLHVLGDFYSTEYVNFWGTMLKAWPELCLFGYTARWDDNIQSAIHTQLNVRYPTRCVIRYSQNQPFNETSSVRFATDESFSGDSFICPEQTGKAASCADCGACWGEHSTKSVRFLSH